MKPKGFGNHLKVLIKLVNATKGPILECGGGVFSTPYLHWACYYNKRKLVTLDNEAEWFNQLKDYGSLTHTVKLVDDWNKADLSGHWDVALIDSHPNIMRIEIIKRIANNCDYILLHDAEGRNNGKYHYYDIYKLFKYHKGFTDELPHLIVLSNLKDLTWLGGEKE